MKNEWGIAIFVVGILLVGAGFYPLRREVKTEEKGVREETWWREETGLKEVTKMREESYVEEVKKEEYIKEVLFKKSGTLMKDIEPLMFFDLKSGDKIIFKLRSSTDISVSFFGEGQKLLYDWKGWLIEKEFEITKDGSYILGLVPLSSFVIPVVNLDLVTVRTIIKVEKIQKTRIIEYTEKVLYTTKIPYTTNVPYTIITEKTEKYNIEALRYVGLFLILADAFIFWKNRKS
jgi:hypothetical protein